MLRVFRTICALLPIVALAILLDASFATQHVSAKPIPIPPTIAVSNPGLNTEKLKSYHYSRSMPRVPEPRDGKRTRTKPSQPPTKPASEVQTWTGKSVVAREQRPPNRASWKGQPSDPRDIQPLRSESGIVSRRKKTPPHQHKGNAPRTSSFKKKTKTLKRQEREMKHSAEKFHRLARHHHRHNDTAVRRHASHSLREFYGHAKAANATVSQLALNGPMDAAQSGELEVIIGDIVNTVSQVLSEAAMLTGNIPILGPELEGVATQIQSLLTIILDTAQSLLDNVLGTLSPVVDSVLPGIL